MVSKNPSVKIAKGLQVTQDIILHEVIPNLKKEGYILDWDKRARIYWDVRKIGWDHLQFTYPKIYKNIYPMVKKHHRRFKVIEDVLFYYLFVEKGDI